MSATVVFPTGFPYQPSNSLNGWRRRPTPRHAQAQAIGHGGDDVYPIAGLTASVTLPGELVVTHAEILALATIAQLVQPGTPVV